MNIPTAIPASYDYRLVTLSVAIAIFASYVALDLAGRVMATRGYARLMWLVGGATSMGTGIWAMHYTGMLAYRLPMRVYYHLPTVLLSLLAAIFASFITLYVVSRPHMTALNVVGGSLLMGAAIPVMHYTGMAAVTFTPMAMAPDLSYAIDISELANSAIVRMTLVILGCGLLTSLLDRRFSAQARELALSEQ